MRTKLDETRLQDLLADDGFVRLLVVLESTGSTNDDLRRLAAEGAPEGTVVIADHQTAGRGRLGRRWESAPGLGLSISALFRPSVPADEIPRFTLGASVAAALACREDGGPPAEIRWPNDVFAGGRKIAGILAEARSTGSSASELIVGAGFNVNHTRDDLPEDLRSTAGSIRMALGRAVDREPIAARYLRGLGAVARSLSSGGWEKVLADWTLLSPRSRGSRVRVVSRESTKGAFVGTTRGVDGEGALSVEREDGSMTLVRLDETVTFPEG